MGDSADREKILLRFRLGSLEEALLVFLRNWPRKVFDKSTLSVMLTTCLISGSELIALIMLSSRLFYCCREEIN